MRNDLVLSFDSVSLRQKHLAFEALVHARIARWISVLVPLSGNVIILSSF